MDIDQGHPRGQTLKILPPNPAHRILQRDSPARRQSTPASSKDDTAIEGSFHSAREDVRDRTESVAPETQERIDASVECRQPEPHTGPIPANAEVPRPREQAEQNTIWADPDDSHPSSQASSPGKTIARKSSLTFATLPAPEPWTTKKSMGATAGIGRGSFLGRVTGGKPIGNIRQFETESQNITRAENYEENEGVTSGKPGMEREESESSNMRRMHNKSSTQTLQDKINALGQSQGPRPTKSIPNVASATVTYPDVQDNEASRQKANRDFSTTMQAASTDTNDNEDDSWILPPRQKTEETSSSSQTTNKVQKSPNTEATKSSLEVAQVEIPQANEAKIQESISMGAKPDPTAFVSYSESDEQVAQSEGPLSASKSKLQSIMKSARGLFSSSAGVSAQAKMEAFDSPAARTRGKVVEQDAKDSPNVKSMQQMSTMTKEIKDLSKDVERAVKSSMSPEKQNTGRRTRSSTEKEQRRKIEQLDSTRDYEVASKQSPRKVQKVQAAGETGLEMESYPDIVQPPSSKVAPVSGTSSQTQRPKAIQRPTKPAKEPVQKTKPIPVNIKIGVPSWRGLPTNNTLSTSIQDPLQQAPSKAGGLAKKPSNASLHTVTSSGSIRGAVNGATSKPKALLVAERKREQDEREAQRKQEARKEIERKRAAQQEEARQQEIERHREQERLAQESKKAAAAKQAIEKRRLESKNNQRVPQHDRGPLPRFRPETHDSRPPSRMEPSRPGPAHALQNPPRTGIKRVAEKEPEEETRPIRVPAGPAYTANEAKRRRTEDEEDFRETGIRPTMQPPKRVSTAQKVSFSRPFSQTRNADKPQNHFKPSIFSSNAYTTAPPPAAHHQSQSMLKSSTINPVYPSLPSIQSQPSRPPPAHDISKYATTKPPFAENPNPASTATYKTPNNLLKHIHLSSAAVKTASPSSAYPNGENVHLSDIATDPDSSPDTAQKAHNRAKLPSWALSPAINEALQRQEEMLDADAVFGPVQTPKLEEMFRGGRAGNGGFRARTSSANWKDSGDCLTMEEVRRDREARARLRMRGGWEFGAG